MGCAKLSVLKHTGDGTCTRLLRLLRLFFCVWFVESETVTTLFLQVKIKNGSLNTSLSRNKFLPFQGKTMAILEGTFLFVLRCVIIHGGVVKI